MKCARNRWISPWFVFVLLCSQVLAGPIPDSPAAPEFINTWLLLGPFANDSSDTGFQKAWVEESEVAPAAGKEEHERAWTFFDDRLFSRNYDDYQDLFSFFRTKRGEKLDGAVVYAHVYVFSPNVRR